jgi:hypothetical protein
MTKFGRGECRHSALISALSLSLLAVIAFFTMARLLGVFLLPSLIEQNLLDAKVEQALRYPDTNLVVIGPSYIDMGFNPDVFDAETKAKGVESHSFNMGMDGLSLIEMRAVIEHLLEEKPCCIKDFIMSPCYECLNVVRNSDSARGIAFFDLRHGLAFVNYVLQYEVLPDDILTKSDFVRNILSSIFRHYTNLGLAVNGFGLARSESLGPNLLSAAFWDERGPRGHGRMYTTMNQEDAREYESRVLNYPGRRKERIQALEHQPRPDVPDLVTDEMFEVFIEEVRFLRARGIDVLVVIPPNMWEWTYHAAFLIRLRAQCGDDIPFVDFGDAEKWPELFLPPSIRDDAAHMNVKGALVWSKVLADQFAMAVQTRMPPQRRESHRQLSSAPFQTLSGECRIK